MRGELGPEGDVDLLPHEPNNGPRRTAALHRVHHQESRHPLQVMEKIQPQGPAIQEGDTVRKIMTLLQQVNNPDPYAIVGHDQVADPQDQCPVSFNHLSGES